MSKKPKRGGKAPLTDNLRLDPEQRLCPKFDSASIAKYPIASRDEMGMRVRDNCAEENMK